MLLHKENAMKTVSALLAALVLTATIAADEVKPTAKPAKSGGAYVHVVVFTMKKDAPKDAVDSAIADCRKLLEGIPSVRTLRAGRPAEKGTPDLAKKDYDFALVIFVDDFAGLKAYLEHADHLKFVEKHGKNFNMEKLAIFDFADAKK
jgi:hypothetical protein